jgi:hypothetical protein
MPALPLRVDALPDVRPRPALPRDHALQRRQIQLQLKFIERRKAT